MPYNEISGGQIKADKHNYKTITQVLNITVEIIPSTCTSWSSSKTCELVQNARHWMGPQGNSYMCCVCMSASVLMATNLIRIHAVNGLRPDSWWLPGSNVVLRGNICTHVYTCFTFFCHISILVSFFSLSHTFVFLCLVHLYSPNHQNIHSSFPTNSHVNNSWSKVIFKVTTLCLHYSCNEWTERGGDT